MVEFEAPDWLSPEAVKIFRATLPKIKAPDPEKIRMLAAYADCVAHLRRCRGDWEKFRVWKGAATYSLNGLGLGKPLFIDHLDLLCDSGWPGEDDPTYHLDPAWQIERPANYATAPLNY